MKKAIQLKSRKNVHKIEFFDDNIDSFFDISSESYDVILVRNAEYLNWRYARNPDDYNIFLIKDNEKILGYMVTKVGLFANLKVGYIADFLTINNKIIFKNLLHEALKDFYKKKG